MGYVKISVVFFLWIFLLSCSSHALDHLPEVIRSGDRRLLSLLNDIRPGFIPKNDPVDHTRENYHVPENTFERNDPTTRPVYTSNPNDPTTRPVYTSNPNDPTTRPVYTFERNDPTTIPVYTSNRNQPNTYSAIGKDKKRLKDWIEENTQAEEVSESEESAATKIGEAFAKKLFRANRYRHFRIGWKVGKWIYKVDKKCKKFEKALNITCDDHSLLLDETPGMSCVMLVAGTTGYFRCNEGVVTPGSIPCLFNGEYHQSGMPFGLVTENPLKDCASN